LLDECGLDEKTKETLLRIILRKLGPPPVTIRAVVEVACNRYEGNGGIEVVGFACSTNDIPIRVHLIAPSFYGMIVGNYPFSQLYQLRLR
jgi:translation initiation factor 2 subunit 1